MSEAPLKPESWYHLCRAAMKARMGLIQGGSLVIVTHVL